MRSYFYGNVMVNSINALFNKVEEKEMRIKEEMKELDETINPIEKKLC